MRLYGALIFVMLGGTGAVAQSLDVPVMEMVGDGQAATCGVSQVSGLKAGGDGFLAIRSGPGGKYRKIGELHNGDKVTSLGRKGDWVAVITKDSTVNHDDICANDGPEREIIGNGVGWAHGKWLTYLYP